jgi:hypothetical protein
MEKENGLNETLKIDFSALTEKNKKKVVDMTRFLVITQNKIVPELLNSKDIPALMEKEEANSSVEKNAD